MTNQDTKTITTCVCDDCGRRGPGVEFTSLGVPVLFVCRACEPNHFDRTARRDIDAWLKGDDR